MPLFKSTQDIFKGGEEVYNSNDYNSMFLKLPPNPQWDDSRPLQVQDVDIWEVLTEMSGPTGIYASWCPYSDFYMIVLNNKIDSTYYGEDSDIYAAKRAEELNIPYPRKNDTIGKR